MANAFRKVRIVGAAVVIGVCLVADLIAQARK